MVKKLLLILILVFPFNSFAVIAFDAVTSSICSSCGTTKTLSHTPVGTPDLIVACSMGQANPGVAGVSTWTYGGQNMSEAVELTGVENGDISIWYLASPPSGAQSAVVTWGASVPSDHAGIAIMSLTGAGGVGSNNKGSQNTANLSLTLTGVDTDAWMVDCFFIASDTTTATTAGSGQTERWDLVFTDNRQGTGSTEPDPTADGIMTYTLGGSKAVGYAAVEITASVAGAAVEEQPYGNFLWNIYESINKFLFA